MNNYVGMTKVKKKQGQDDYFNQKSIFLTLPANTSPLIISSTYVDWCEKYAFLIEIIILSLFFFNHCHSYIAVHFLEMFLLLVYFIF